MRPGAREEGQASPEYAGLVLVLALFAGALLAAVNPGTGIARSVESALCRALDASCTESDEAPRTQREILDAVLVADLEAFQEYKDSADHDPRMDYSDDNCSAPVLGSSGPGFDFTVACERHDFGYRNSKRLGVFGEYKTWIDAIFLRDMRATCDAASIVGRGQCRAMAELYYAGVRAGGGFTGRR